MRLPLLECEKLPADLLSCACLGRKHGRPNSSLLIQDTVDVAMRRQLALRKVAGEVAYVNTASLQPL